MKQEVRSDVWNPMVKLINKTKDSDVKAQATRLLGQYNTSGGNMIKNELESFLQQHGF